MTDRPFAAAEHGRSLWADAWARLKANRAAMISAAAEAAEKSVGARTCR